MILFDAYGKQLSRFQFKLLIIWSCQLLGLSLFTGSLCYGDNAGKAKDDLQARSIKPLAMGAFEGWEVKVLESLESGPLIVPPSQEATLARKSEYSYRQKRKVIKRYRNLVADKMRDMPRKHFEKSHYEHTDGHKLDYLLVKPSVKSGQLYPLVVSLHGTGGWQDDIYSLAKVPGYSLMQRSDRFPCFLLVPQADKNELWGYADSTRKTRESPNWRKTWKSIDQSLVGLVKATAKSHPIDTSRIYVMGASMGGLGTMAMVTQHKDIFAAGISMVAVIWPEDAARLDCPLWLFTSEFDEFNTIGMPSNFAYFKKARESGKRVQLTMFTDQGHSIYHLVSEYPGVWTWLFSQRKAK